MAREGSTDILVIGGGTGGVAAALAAAALGKRVILAEETDWLGGQLTAQAVPPDEHRWIESFGCTRRYRQYRNGVRQYYRDHFPLTPDARANPSLNPGLGSVSRLCHEFRVGVAVIDQLLAFARSRGQVEVRLRCRPVAAEVDGDRVHAVRLRSLQGDEDEVIRAAYFLDATELGDLLPLAGAEYVTGAESQDETGEPHAPSGPPQPDNIQGITWCFPVAYDPTRGASYVIEKPGQYEFWRDYVPPTRPPWTGRLLGWTHPHPHTCEPRQRVLFPHEGEHPGQSLWRYRRIITSEHYAPGVMPHEVTLVNWPQNDYFVLQSPSAGRAGASAAAGAARAANVGQPMGSGKAASDVFDRLEQHYQDAKQLSLSLLYWLQTEAPRPDGGTGYPGLYLRPDLVGTPDGLAKYPYIRESRRISAAFTVTELHVGAEARGVRPGEPGVGEHFDDAVGIGYYRLDLHPSTGHDNYIDFASLPFQIPLGALLPVRVENLLPACKNLGVTHLANGCYRLHPVEWNIGEAAGYLAAYCVDRGLRPRQVREREQHLRPFQDLLRAQGVELEWPRVG